MSIFNDKSNAELVEMAQQLYKRDTKTIDRDGKTYVLCGTDMAYEENLCDNIFNTFKDLAGTLGLKVTYEMYCDTISEVRDKILEAVLVNNNATMVIGYDEY